MTGIIGILIGIAIGITLGIVAGLIIMAWGFHEMLKTHNAVSNGKMYHWVKRKGD